MSKSEIQISETFLTDAEATERFKTISQFLIDFQKQYFESLKFSLNMWIVINSGAAIALLGRGNSTDALNVIGFMAGALSSGVGNILLFVFSKNCLEILYCFVLNTNLKHHDLVTSLSMRHNKMYWNAAWCLSISYGLFIISAITLKFS